MIFYYIIIYSNLHNKLPCNSITGIAFLFACFEAVVTEMHLDNGLLILNIIYTSRDI